MHPSSFTSAQPDGLPDHWRTGGWEAAAEAVFSPLTPAELAARLAARELMHLRGESARFAHLLNESDVLALVSGPSYEPGLATVVAQGRIVPRERFCAKHPMAGKVMVHAGMVRSLLAGGCALIAAQLQRHHAPLWELSASLTQLFGADVNVNAYYGRANSRGFDLHVDHHDVVVLQVMGRKRWYVAPPTCESPLVIPDHNGEPPAEIPWSAVLESGDVLFLPRGYWHRAEGTDDAPTLHLSCGIQPCTGLHLLHFMREQLMADPLLRADLPRFGSRDELQAHAERLREHVLAAWNESLLPRFLDDYLARALRDNLDGKPPQPLSPSIPPS